MTKISHLTEFFTEQKATFLLFFAKSPNLSVDDIHHFRLAIKRLRAICSMINEIPDHGFREEIDELISLTSEAFHLAGKVREAQISMKHFARVESPLEESFEHYLKAQEESATGDLVKYLKVFDIKHFETLGAQIEKHIEQFSEEQIQTVSTEFIADSHKKLKKLAKKLPDRKKLHKIRIELKALMEILGIYKEVSGRKKVVQLFLEVHELTDVIGDWHDLSNLLQEMKRFSKTIKIESEKNEWKAQQKKFKKEMSGLEIKIARNLSDLLNSEVLRKIG